jgi:hypothetical protein
MDLMLRGLESKGVISLHVSMEKKFLLQLRYVLYLCEVSFTIVVEYIYVTLLVTDVIFCCNYQLENLLLDICMHFERTNQPNAIDIFVSLLHVLSTVNLICYIAFIIVNYS